MSISIRPSGLAGRARSRRELCLENTLVELLYRRGGFTEVRWLAEVRADQRGDAEPALVRSGARALTSAGLGIVRRVTPAEKAVIDLDAGGSVALDASQILGVSDGRGRDGCEATDASSWGGHSPFFSGDAAGEREDQSGPR